MGSSPDAASATTATKETDALSAAKTGGGDTAPHRRCCPCRSVSSNRDRSFPNEELLCPACVREHLRSRLERRQAALEARDLARRRCAERLTGLRSGEARGVANTKSTGGEDVTGAPPSSAAAELARVRDDSDRLRARLDALRGECSAASVRLASITMRNDQREAALAEERRIADRTRAGLEILASTMLQSSLSVEADKTAGSAVVDGTSLSDALDRLTKEVRRERFQLALRAFDMHRIDIGREMVETLQREDSSGGDSLTVRTPSGIGKIGGLPLPHAGPTLYSFLPRNVLSSSLRMVSSLTLTLARCLSILLPHPILLRPSIPNARASRRGANSSGGAKSQQGDIIDVATLPANWDSGFTFGEDLDGAAEDGRQMQNPVPSPSPTAVSSSISSLKSLMGSSPSIRSFGKALARAATGGNHTNSSNKSCDNKQQTSQAERVRRHDNNKESKPPPMDEISISRRLQHACAAVLCESVRVGEGGGDPIPVGAEYALVPPRWSDTPGAAKSSSELSVAVRSKSGGEPDGNSASDISTAEVMREQEERFAIGLQLLQNDVAALCIRAGVPVATLWPAEALLLNLYSLREHLLDDDGPSFGAVP